MLEQLASTLEELPELRGPAPRGGDRSKNVTGEMWPLAEIAEITHRFGARLLVDAAQLAPHAPIDMQRDGIDYLALSGHKLYAPYGAGALIGKRGLARPRRSFLRGGGAVRLVTIDETLWAELPDRQEAGSPNVVGAVALGVACDTLAAAGMDRIAAEEPTWRPLPASGSPAIDGFEHYAVWADDHPGSACSPSTCRRAYDLLAAVLSAEHGIGIRHGCFCAHPLMVRLLHVADDEVDRLLTEMRAGHHERLPGAARMSLGLGSTSADIDALAHALRRSRPTGRSGRIPSTRRAAIRARPRHATAPGTSDAARRASPRPRRVGLRPASTYDGVPVDRTDVKNLTIAPTVRNRLAFWALAGLALFVAHEPSSSRRSAPARRSSQRSARPGTGTGRWRASC